MDYQVAQISSDRWNSHSTRNCRRRTSGVTHPVGHEGCSTLGHHDRRCTSLAACTTTQYIRSDAMVAKTMCDTYQPRMQPQWLIKGS